jgi:indole-3-glycerol phosphate synthase
MKIIKFDKILLLFFVDFKQRNIVEYANAADMAAYLSQSNVDAIMVNTDKGEYRGKFEDLKDAIAGSVKAKPFQPPPIIQKDFIIHPIQVSHR